VILWGLAAVVSAQLASVPADTSGVALGVLSGGGVVGRDPAMFVELDAGIETAPCALHLRVPLTLRLMDADPVVSTAAPSWCRGIRCEELLRGQTLDPTAIARLIDEIRLLRPGDAIHARVGRLSATLGAGASVDRVTTTASWDRRTSGLYAGVRLEQLRADVVVADVTAPLELVAGRFELPAMGLPIVIGAEAAADAWAPVGRVDDAAGDVASDDTRLVATTSLDARLPLAFGAVKLAPRLEVAATTGLLPNATASAAAGPLVGAGGAAGVDAAVSASFFEVRALGVVSLGSPGHRRGLFSTFHLFERRQALAGSVVPGGGLALVPAPGGVGLDLRLDASVLQVATMLARLHLEPAPGANAAELGVAIDLEPVQLSVSAIRRAFARPLGIVDADVVERPLVLAAEAAWKVWGPVSLWARWYRLPRTQAGAVVFDDDVVVGLGVAGLWRPG
jgi:hypothetical protein